MGPPGLAPTVGACSQWKVQPAASRGTPVRIVGGEGILVRSVPIPAESTPHFQQCLARLARGPEAGLYFGPTGPIADGEPDSTRHDRLNRTIMCVFIIVMLQRMLVFFTSHEVNGMFLRVSYILATWFGVRACK